MIKYIGIGILVIGLMSCKKVAKFTQFDMEFENECVIPSSTGVSLPLDIITPDTETNSESTFAVNDTRKDKIEEITLTELDMTITSPNGQDFSFLESINLYLNADGLDEVLIAWKNPVPQSATTLMLETTELDMKEYIKKDEFTLRINCTTDEVITSDHHLNVRSKYFVDAEILGQ